MFSKTLKISNCVRLMANRIYDAQIVNVFVSQGIYWVFGQSKRILTIVNIIDRIFSINIRGWLRQRNRKLNSFSFIVFQGLEQEGGVNPKVTVFIERWEQTFINKMTIS